MTLTQINKAGLDEIALDHVFTIGASGNSAYTFQGEGLNGTVNNPTLYLTRGKTYRFENGSGAHPIRIQNTSGPSGSAYNTGVTNNAGSGTVIVEVQHNAPDVLYYQCTSHASMNGILYITGVAQDGTITTDKIAANAVTGPKIASDSIDSGHYVDGSIDTAHIADSQITTAKIADQAVTLAKLPHGTSSNDGKFLRANNGADPSFETVSIPAGTTINNNADNRVITGSDTANTLEGESNLIYDGLRLGINRTPTTNADYPLQIKSANATAFTHFRNSQSAGDDPNANGGLVGLLNDNMYLWSRESSSQILFGTDNSERARLDSSGRLGLHHNLSGAADYNRLVVHNPNSGSCWMQLTSTSSGNGINTDGLAIGLNSSNIGHVWLRENADLVFATNGTKRMSILSGGGLAFNNDTAQANALDDYEEGTWTPVLSNVFAAGVSSGRVCVYRKIGQFVFFSFDIFKSANNMDINTSGNTIITGLPFTPLSSFNSTMTIGVYMGDNSQQYLTNYIDTTPQIVINGHSRINNVRHLWGFGCYAAT